MEKNNQFIQKKAKFTKVFPVTIIQTNFLHNKKWPIQHVLFLFFTLENSFNKHTQFFFYLGGNQIH